MTMMTLSFAGESIDALAEQLDQWRHLLRRTRAQGFRSDEEVLEMIARANDIGLRRAAAEYRVSPSWLSKVRAGKLRPHLQET